MNTAANVAPPPERFNFAEHLLALNSTRGAKPAFVDDHGTLTYGALDERVRRMAAALRSLYLRREERVLVLMHDGTDWPVAFLGSLYAGLVPVAVNTLLTPDDYAYMLEHSRAQAVLVSGALLPTLTTAMVKSDHEVQKVIVSHPQAPLHPSEVEFEAFLKAHAPMDKAAPTGPDDPAFWLYSSGSTGRPKGVVTSHGALADDTAAMRDYLELTPQDNFLFFAAIGWAFLRGPAQGACELLWLCAGVTLLIPVTSLAGVWGIGGAWNHARGWPVDLTALAAAPVFVLLAWHTRRRMLQGHADSVWAGAATTTTSSPRLPADSGAGT